METITKKIVRKHGEGVAIITDTAEGRKYSWDYPFAREIGAKLRHGDIVIIAEKLELSDIYVGLIMNGKKYNESVIDFALLLIEKREELMAIEF